MKKLLIVILFLGFYAKANMHKSHGFLAVNAGSVVKFSDWSFKKDFVLTLGYGRDLMSQGNYYGFLEVGLGGILDDELVYLKYGYDFIKEGDFSAGLDASLSFAVFNWINFEDWDGVELGFGNTVGAFVKLKITPALFVLLRGGAKHKTKFNKISDIVDKIVPYADLGVQFYL